MYHTTRLKFKGEGKTQKPKVSTEAIFTLRHLPPTLVTLNFCFDNLMGREKQVSWSNLTQGDPPTMVSWATSWISRQTGNKFTSPHPGNYKRYFFGAEQSREEISQRSLTISWPYSISWLGWWFHGCLENYT